MIVLLDTGPLGLVTNPRATTHNDACRAWMATLAQAGVRIIVPEIADYELRRELLRLGRTRGLAYLDRLEASAEYAPITTAIIRRAAELWADARRGGAPTAPTLALDGDVILGAQAQLLAIQENDRLIIATTNPGHLSRYAEAELWHTITPSMP
jgi:predicted nucleic acid-binding protein